MLFFGTPKEIHSLFWKLEVEGSKLAVVSSVLPSAVHLSRPVCFNVEEEIEVKVTQSCPTL